MCIRDRYYTERKEYDKAIKFVEETLVNYNELNGLLNMEHEFLLHYNAGLAQYHRGEYNQSLKWINKVINLTSKDLRVDVKASAYILHILIHYDLENNVDLEISKYLIVKKLVLKDTLSIKDLSKFEVLKNDTIINSKTSETFFVKKISDSLFTNYVYKDTLFIINKENVLRKMKRYYFLNSKNNENTWIVKKLILKNGQININDISTIEEIEMLEEITETKRDTWKPFIVKPTKKQFKEFVKRNGFTEGEIYLKN